MGIDFAFYISSEYRPLAYFYFEDLYIANEKVLSGCIFNVT